MRLEVASVLALVAVTAVPALALTQTTVREMREGSSVTLSGQVVRVQGEDFVLDDGTGQILVEAESRPLRQANLRAGDQVTVSGIYDDDNSLEAYSIMPVGGDVIYIFDD